MKGVLIYLLALILWFPPVLLVSCNNPIVAFVGVMWGVVLYHSPKFSPAIKKFWRQFYRVNFRVLSYFS